MDNSGTNTENYGINYVTNWNTSSTAGTELPKPKKLHPLVELLRRL